MIEPATLNDIIHVSVHMRADDLAEVMATRWDTSPFSFAVDHARLNGSRFVARAKDGEPAAVGGVAIHRPGVGQAWLIGTPRIGECRREIARWVPGFFRSVMGGDQPLHRLQAFSSETHAMAHRWLKSMGFNEESRMPKYGKNGETFVTFSIVE